MTSPPSADQVAANANSGTFDTSTPGLNAVVSAWGALQDFVGSWSQNFVTEVQAFTNYAASTIGGN